MHVSEHQLEGTDGPRSLRPRTGPYLLLLFYQEDRTPTCTTELASFRDEFALLTELGAEVVAISTDDVASHRDFLERIGGLPFPLLSDPEGVAARELNAWDPLAKRSMRAAFVVDPEGEVLHAACPYNPNDLPAFEQVFHALGLAG